LVNNEDDLIVCTMIWCYLIKENLKATDWGTYVAMPPTSDESLWCSLVHLLYITLDELYYCCTRDWERESWGL